MNWQPPDPPEYGHCLTCKSSVHESEVRGGHCIECEGQAMNNNEMVSVPRALLSNIEMTWRQASGFSNKANDIIATGLEQLRALLAAPACSTCQDHGVVGWTSGQTPESFDMGEAPCPDCQPEPSTDAVALTAVATLRDDGDGGLEPDWLLEGGTAKLFEGMVLLVADQDQTLCEEDGHVELYRRPVQPLPFPGYPAVPEDRQLSIKCDGNHGAPACADPECWNSDLVSAYIMTMTSHNKETGGTLYWFGRLDRADEMRALKIEAAGPREAWDELRRQLSAATTPAPATDLGDAIPDPHTGCPLNHGRGHNSHAPKDAEGCLVCTCGFNWRLPF